MEPRRRAELLATLSPEGRATYEVLRAQLARDMDRCFAESKARLEKDVEAVFGDLRPNCSRVPGRDDAERAKEIVAATATAPALSTPAVSHVFPAPVASAPPAMRGDADPTAATPIPADVAASAVTVLVPSAATPFVGEGVLHIEASTGAISAPPSTALGEMDPVVVTPVTCSTMGADHNSDGEDPAAESMSSGSVHTFLISSPEDSPTATKYLTIGTYSLPPLLPPVALDTIDTTMTERQYIYEDSRNLVQNVNISLIQHVSAVHEFPSSQARQLLSGQVTETAATLVCFPPLPCDHRTLELPRRMGCMIPGVLMHIILGGFELFHWKMAWSFNWGCSKNASLVLYHFESVELKIPWPPPVQKSMQDSLPVKFLLYHMNAETGCYDCALLDVGQAPNLLQFQLLPLMRSISCLCCWNSRVPMVYWFGSEFFQWEIAWAFDWGCSASGNEPSFELQQWRLVWFFSHAFLQPKPPWSHLASTISADELGSNMRTVSELLCTTGIYFQLTILLLPWDPGALMYGMRTKFHVELEQKWMVSLLGQLAIATFPAMPYTIHHHFPSGNLMLLNTAAVNSDIVTYLHSRGPPASNESACVASKNLVVPNASTSPGFSFTRIGIVETFTPGLVVRQDSNMLLAVCPGMLQITKFCSKGIISWAYAMLKSLCGFKLVHWKIAWSIVLESSASGNKSGQLLFPTTVSSEGYFEKRRAVLPPFSPRTVQASLQINWSHLAPTISTSELMSDMCTVFESLHIIGTSFELDLLGFPAWSLFYARFRLEAYFPLPSVDQGMLKRSLIMQYTVNAVSAIAPWPPPSCTRARTSLIQGRDLFYNAQQKRGKEFLVVGVKRSRIQGQASAFADMLQTHSFYSTRMSTWEGALLVGNQEILTRCNLSGWNSFEMELVLDGYWQAWNITQLQFSQLTWDPGGWTQRRLEGKPKFKEGGLSTTSALVHSWAGRCAALVGLACLKSPQPLQVRRTWTETTRLGTGRMASAWKARIG